MKIHAGDIDVKLELGPLIAPLAEMELSKTLARRVEAELGELLEELGLPGDPRVAVTVAPRTTRPVRIRVHDSLQPYSPHLAARAWLSVAPQDLAAAPAARITGERGFPVGWLAELLDSEDRDAATWSLVAAWVEALATQAILKHPSCLVGSAQIEAYAYAHNIHGADLAPLVRGLLDLGLSVVDGAALARRLDEGRTLARSLEDTLEATFSDLRSHRIELLAAPATLGKLLRQAASIDEPLSVYDPRIPDNLKLLFYDLEATFVSVPGVALPDLVWVPSPLLAEGTLVIAMDAWRSLPTPLVRRGERLVNKDPVALRGVSSRATLDPLTGIMCAVVDDSLRVEVEAEGFTTWGPVDFVILNLASELARRPGRLLGLEEVEHGLAQLIDDTRADDRLNPVVWEALERYTLGELARIFRAMLAERLSIADQRTLLEHIVQFDTVPLTDPDLRLVDDRLPVPRGLPPEEAFDWSFVYAYLRRQLKAYLTREYTWWENTVLAYSVSPALEHRMLKPNLLDEDEIEAFRDALWTVLGQLSPTPFGQIVLTNSLARPAVRELLASEFPDLPVVARYELMPDVSIQIIDTIDSAWEPVTPRPVGPRLEEEVDA